VSLTFDTVNTPAAATGTTNAVTTASFSPAAGSLIALLYAANHPTSTTDVSLSSVTNTGGAVSWSRRVRKNQNASSDGGVGTAGGAEIWTGVAPGGAITVTGTGVASGAGTEKFLKPVVFTGADIATLNHLITASATSGLPSAILSGVAAGSYVLAVSSDWQALGAGTAGSGQTMMDEFHTPSQMTMHSWRTTAVTSAGSVTMNLTAPAGQQYNLCVLEILDAGGSAAVSDGLLPRLPTHLIIDLAARRQRLEQAGIDTAVTASPETGAGLLALSGSAAAVKVAVQNGRAVLGVAGQGAAARRAPQSGTTELGLTGTAAATRRAAAAGAAVAALTGTGAATRRATAAGTALLALAGTAMETTGTARPQSGRAVAALTCAGTVRRTAVPSGRALLAVTGTGAASRRAVEAGTAVAALRGTGAARKTATAAGSGLLALTGAGLETVGTARPQSGTAALALTGAAAALRRAAPAATAVLAVRGAGLAGKRAPAAGRAVVLLAGSATEVRIAATTGRAVVAVVPYQVVPLPTNPPGAAFRTGSDRALLAMLGADRSAGWSTGSTAAGLGGGDRSGGPGGGRDRPTT
jgi:hypothetical protein